MKVYETFQDSLPETPHIGKFPFERPRIRLCVGERSNRVINPYLVLWSGVQGRVLAGPNYETFVLNKSADRNLIGTHIAFDGTFVSGGQPRPGFLGSIWPWVVIAEVEIWGDLNRWRPGSQRNYDGVYGAEAIFGDPGSTHYGGTWGNHTFAANLIPFPWESLNPPLKN